MKESFPTEADHTIRLKRAKMRAWRRGMREMDLILGGFIDKNGPTLTVEQLDAFELLLARRDQDLYDWVSEHKPVSADAATAGESALITQMRVNWRDFEENSL